MKAKRIESADAHSPSLTRHQFGDEHTPFSAAPIGAKPPRAPALPARLQATDAEQRASRVRKEAFERRSMLRGLLLLAVLTLVIALALSASGRAFPVGWWRRW